MPSDQDRLTEIHRAAAASYASGCRDRDALVPNEDAAFLASLGISTQVLLDYVEDFSRSGEPDLGTFVRVVEIRRDYFRTVLGGKPAGEVVPEPELPLREHSWNDIPWLPRITKKAECFLEGSLCLDVMYGCSGDRAFLRKHALTLPGFLEAVRDADGIVEDVIAYVDKA